MAVGAGVNTRAWLYMFCKHSCCLSSTPYACQTSCQCTPQPHFWPMRSNLPLRTAGSAQTGADSSAQTGGLLTFRNPIPMAFHPFLPKQAPHCQRVFLAHGVPTGTLFEGGLFRMKLALPADVPHSPPKGALPPYFGTPTSAFLCPAGTPFEGGLFRMKLALPADFPHSPPKGAFTTIL
jgi:hypothetical protein